jgi:hypothetical protein
MAIKHLLVSYHSEYRYLPDATFEVFAAMKIEVVVSSVVTPIGASRKPISAVVLIN